MISSTPRTDHRRRAFTLVEVLMASALSGLVLAGVLSAFGFIVQTSQRAAQYSGMEAGVRRGLETFARDARAAVDVRWENAQQLRLMLPGEVPEVVYAYDAEPTSPTYRALYRQEKTGSGLGPRRVLVSGLAPDFHFERYRIGPADGDPAPAANDLETKQIQVVLRAESAGIGAGAAATHAAVSARYVLRNKKVSN